MTTLKEIFECIKKRLLLEAKLFYGERLVSVIIFGSSARQTQRYDSDVDILIIAKDLPNGRIKRVLEFEAIEDKMEEYLKSFEKYGVYTYLSPIFKTPEEAEKGSPLFFDMVEDAELLFDRDNFFRGIIDKMKNRMAELGSKRVWKDNSWYWILKPDYKPKEVFEL